MKRILVVALLVTISVSTLAAVFDWERAVSLYKQGQFREAIAEFQAVLAEYPDHPDSWKYVGLSYYQLKDYAAAIAPLEKALELKRKDNRLDPDLFRALGQSHLALNQFDKALPYLDTLTKSQANVAVNFHLLGVVYSNLNRPEEAAEAFRKASKLDPKDGDSFYFLAVQQFRTGKLTDTVATLRAGLVAQPQNAEMLGLLAETLLRYAAAETDERKAGTLYDEATRVAMTLKNVKDDAAAAELLGRAYLATKRYQQAETMLSKAVEGTKTPSATLYFNLGFALAQNKSWPRAAEMFANADKLNPKDANTLYYLGFVYENQRRYPQALEAYTKAYEASGRSNADIKASVDRVTPFAKP
ncbi:MAG TPA: tetratricopeptide repeat protein [Blastocatellia bacterium]|nr:tetratricopeptide repeat protein [Blastocatellia bacterium]